VFREGGGGGGGGGKSVVTAPGSCIICRVVICRASSNPSSSTCVGVRTLVSAPLQFSESNCEGCTPRSGGGPEERLWEGRCWRGGKRSGNSVSALFCSALCFAQSRCTCKPESTVSSSSGLLMQGLVISESRVSVTAGYLTN